MDRMDFTRLAPALGPMEVREFSLPGNSVLRIEDGAGLLLTVTFGCVWLTQDEESKDRVLSVGSTFRLDRDGTCLVTAFQRSSVALATPVGFRGLTGLPGR